jgi:hypothetical protein
MFHPLILYFAIHVVLFLHVCKAMEKRTQAYSNSQIETILNSIQFADSHNLGEKLEQEECLGLEAT